MLAGLGYVAFAVDMYGNGKTADNPSDAGKFAGETIAPAKKGSVKAKILVCNGASDKFISEEDIKIFKSEMESAGANFRFISYENAMHSFTNPASTENGKKFNMPIAYNENADKKSWTDMKEFFQMIFKE